MKIDVITLHRVYNYGSALQAYATQKFLEKKGFEVQIIDYITPQRTKKRIFLTPAADESKFGVKLFLYRIAKISSLVLKEWTFGKFVKHNLNLTKKYISVDDLEKDIPKADIYVTGSDQTWNSKYNEGVDRGFFLDFLPENSKKIAFVSSFGKEYLDENEKEKTREYLSKYNLISVREDQAANIIENLGLVRPIQLIDPTLLLTKNEWIKLASKRLVKERYLVLMLLYNEDNHATEYARKIANEKGLKVVKLSWEMKKPDLVDILMTHRQPSDFLSLFYYAEFVVTNSFHGLAFSINLEKQFIIVPRNEFNSRIESLLRLVGLEDRLISSEEMLFKYADRIDYKKINHVLNCERKKADKFINEICEI